MKKTMLIWHCTATKSTMDISVDDIIGWHKTRGWATIGYAGLIKRDGSIQKGRDLDNDGDVADEIGAHAAGFNAQSIGWAYEGGMSENGQPQFNATPEQIESMKFITRETEARFPGIDVLGHCDLPGVKKACPVFDVRAWRKTWT